MQPTRPNVQMLSGEVGATRALGRMFERYPQLSAEWLRGIGIACDLVTAVRVEDPGPTAGRRADIHLQVESRNESKSVVVEAKLDAPVDVGQLQDAISNGDQVISLTPSGIRAPAVEGVECATWEGTIEILRTGAGATAISDFVADEIEQLLVSPKIERRRRMASLVGCSIPDNWTMRVDESTAGGSQLNLEGPDRAGRGASVEITEAVRGVRTPLRAQVLAYSTRCPNDPVVWAALRRVLNDGPPMPPTLAEGKGGRRLPQEREAAVSAGVPKGWTYGFGKSQFEKWNWAGFGPRYELMEPERQDVLIEHALVIAQMIDRALADEGIISPGETTVHSL